MLKSCPYDTVRQVYDAWINGNKTSAVDALSHMEDEEINEFLQNLSQQDVYRVVRLLAKLREVKA